MKYKRFTKKHHYSETVRRAYIRINRQYVPIGWHCSKCKITFPDYNTLLPNLKPTIQKFSFNN